jgi:YesN/AraC family two-component response regulator
MFRIIHTLQVKYAAKRQTKNTLALKAMNYIAANYAWDITISNVAEALYLSNVYLSQIFKNQLGVSIIQY